MFPWFSMVILDLMNQKAMHDLMNIEMPMKSAAHLAMKPLTCAWWSGHIIMNDHIHIAI